MLRVYLSFSCVPSSQSHRAGPWWFVCAAGCCLVVCQHCANAAGKGLGTGQQSSDIQGRKRPHQLSSPAKAKALDGPCEWFLREALFGNIIVGHPPNALDPLCECVQCECTCHCQQRSTQPHPERGPTQSQPNEIPLSCCFVTEQL